MSVSAQTGITEGLVKELYADRVGDGKFFNAEGVKKDDCYSFKDIGSVNGSKINDDKLIPYKLYELKSDDVITLGELSFKYRVNEA
ncbi:FHA domain-containing protein [Salinicoccus sp. HZC-1]|uniref:FHA domain-containing protein n=1 Tax=Salinicoccus sp. HZC-1 TaxID=3385497 RepID=UPI00398BAD0C